MRGLRGGRIERAGKAQKEYACKTERRDGDAVVETKRWMVQVEDMSVVEAIVATPVQEETWGQTHVTTLVNKVEYRPSLEQGGDPANDR